MICKKEFLSCLKSSIGPLLFIQKLESVNISYENLIV